MWRRTRALVTVVLLVGLPVGARAEPEEVREGTVVPFRTLEPIPLGVATATLSEPSRTRAEAVLARTVFAHQVAGLRHRSRPDVFEFLLDRPDFAGSVARALRLGRYRLLPVEDGYWADDGRGASGVIRVLHAEAGRRLYHLEGRYDARGLPVITGQLLVLLEYRHEQPVDEPSTLDADVTGHLRLDSPIIGLLAETVATLTRPLVERAVERKVRRFFGTVARLSRWAHDEPETLAAALRGHPEVPPGPTLDAFLALLVAGRPPAWAAAGFHLLPRDATP